MLLLNEVASVAASGEEKGEKKNESQFVFECLCVNSRLSRS